MQFSYKHNHIHYQKSYIISQIAMQHNVMLSCYLKRFKVSVEWNERSNFELNEMKDHHKRMKGD